MYCYEIPKYLWRRTSASYLPSFIASSQIFYNHYRLEVSRAIEQLNHDIILYRVDLSTCVVYRYNIYGDL